MHSAQLQAVPWAGLDHESLVREASSNTRVLRFRVHVVARLGIWNPSVRALMCFAQDQYTPRQVP